MPNHITNIIHFHKSLADKIINKDGFVDFNLCVPMPPHSDTFFAEGNLGTEERDKYGENNWYDWSCSNWGTKWNAYEQSVWVTDDVCTARFCTAWSTPYRWADVLAQHGDFVMLYADEDAGHDCGIIEVVDGAVYATKPRDVREAYALSLYVQGYDAYGVADYFEGWGKPNMFAEDESDPDSYTSILKEILPDGFELP